MTGFYRPRHKDGVTKGGVEVIKEVRGDKRSENGKGKRGDKSVFKREIEGGRNLGTVCQFILAPFRKSNFA
jgi:hypothetical protein